MKKNSKMIRIITLMLLAFSILALASCGDKNNKEEGKKVVDEFGFERPANAWITDCLILPQSAFDWDIDMQEVIGTGGDSGLLSDFARQYEGYGIEKGYNYFVYLIWGTPNTPGELTGSLRFTLVDGAKLLYDEECVTVNEPQTYYGIDATVDMSKHADERVTVTHDEGEMLTWIVIPFEIYEEGTLYVDFELESPSVSSDNRKVENYVKARVGEAHTNEAEAKIGNVSIGYLTEDKYNYGNYSEGDIIKEPINFSDGSNFYMVLDFDLTALSANRGGYNMNVLTRVPESDIMEATIEEAPTGKIEENNVNGVTLIYASYSVPAAEGETKNVRMIIRLSPLDEGIAGVDIYFTGAEGTGTSGEEHINTQLVTGVPELRYSLTADGKEYIVKDMWKSDLTEINIPDTYKGIPVTGIALDLFKANDRITSLKIGNNVTGLESSAFINCTSLRTVVLGEKLSYLPNYAFKGCTSLTSVTLNGVVTSGKSVFEGCTSLSSVNIPSTMTEISESMFSGCTSLKTVKLPESITRINSYAFSGCSSLSSVTGLENVTFAGSSAFANCTSLSSIAFGSALKTLNSKVFLGCAALKDVTLSPSLTSIPDECFKDCAMLTTVSGLQGAGSMGNQAFTNCTSLVSLDFTSKLTTVQSSAFVGCTALKTIGDTSGVTYFRYKCFYGCTSLEYVDVSAAVGVDREAFYDCTSMKYSDFGPNLEYISSYAFENCRSITSITIGDRCTSVGAWAFRGTSSVKTIYLGRSLRYANDGYYVNEIDGHRDADTHAFDSTSLESITVHASNPVFKGEGNCLLNGPKLILGCRNSVIPTGVLYIGSNAFENARGLTEIAVPANVTDIHESVFAGCIDLVRADLSYVRNLLDCTFDGCTSLTEVVLNPEIERIPYAMLRGCTSINSFTIPDGIKIIGGEAFAGCTGITSMTIPSSVTQIQQNAFRDCSSLTSVKFMGGSWKVYKSQYSSDFEYVYPNREKDAATYLTKTYCEYLWKKS